MNELPVALSRSPELFPFALDARRDSVSFVRLGKSEFETASFLDARVLTPSSVTREIPWTQVAAALDQANLVERCAYIFHIGHVGSTLLSRLIGTHPAAFALREPLILRTFAELATEPDAQQRTWSEADFERRLSGCLQLLSRTFESSETAVIKATSFVSELAARLLSRPSAPRAVLMYVSPESYMATILGGPNSRQEARILTPSRLRRLHRRIGAEVWTAPLSEGEALALGWACEMSALAEAAATSRERILRLNFDDFLAAPGDHLLAVLRLYGIHASAGEISAMLQGPHMRRYSKAPEFAYDAALRFDVLSAARAAQGGEIARGLAWLERAAGEFAVVRGALQLAQSP